MNQIIRNHYRGAAMLGVPSKCLEMRPQKALIIREYQQQADALCRREADNLHTRLANSPFRARRGIFASINARARSLLGLLALACLLLSPCLRAQDEGLPKTEPEALRQIQRLTRGYPEGGTAAQVVAYVDAAARWPQLEAAGRKSPLPTLPRLSVDRLAAIAAVAYQDRRYEAARYAVAAGQVAATSRQDARAPGLRALILEAGKRREAALGDE